MKVEVSNTSVNPISTKLTDVNGNSIDYFPEITPFNEQLTATRTSYINFKPTWGASNFRYTKVETGTGASASETNGEFRLQTGTTTTNKASLETNQRGQYQAGTVGQSGIGFRIPTLPTGTQYGKWGYSDFVNSGLYFGVDATGFYTAYLTGGVETKTYQTSWNVDKLDGTGASGIDIDLSDGFVTQIDFLWYGYGSIEYSILVYDVNTKKTKKILVHVTKIDGSASIIDPNQPLKFEVGNGASSDTNFNLYIGGHQFSIVDGNSIPQKRLVSELLTNYTTVANTLWQPIIAVRKKATFNGRPNSVNVYTESLTVSANDEMEVRVTRGGTTSNLSWATPTGCDANETAIETKITTGTALTTSADGSPIDYGFVNSTKQAQSTFNNEIRTVLGSDEEVIVWIRRISASGTVIVKHAHITTEEQW